MTENESKPRRQPLPSYLRTPALADMLAAVLRTYADGVDTSNPMGAAMHAAVVGFATETDEYGTRPQVRAGRRPLGTVEGSRTGTDG
jgi:hypothetical protein